MNQNICISEDRIENAIIKICELIEAQTNPPENWENYEEERLWLELVSCILGSRVRYETAIACAFHLREKGLLESQSIVTNPRYIERRISVELKKPIYPPFSLNKGSRYRYPCSKAHCIVTTGVQIYGKEGITIKMLLKESETSLEARKSLINKCKGIGPKQASLFLRNISYCDGLAIIDSHVNRFLERFNLTKKYEEAVKENQHSYYKKENVLRLYALSKRKTLANLDRGIWIVMRLIQGDTIL